MRTFARCLTLALVATSSVSAQPRSRSADEERARALFGRGVEAADQTRWAEAAAFFEQSYALVPRPATLRNLAYADRARGRYGRAIEEFERFLATGTPAAPLSREVRRLIDEMRPLLATLTLTVDPANTSVAVDGVTALVDSDVILDPGEHQVLAIAPSYRRHAQSITLSPGEHRRLEIALTRAVASSEIVAPPPSEEPRASRPAYTRWWFWTTIGVVVAGGVAASVLLLSSEASPDCGSLGRCVTPQ